MRRRHLAALPALPALSTLLPLALGGCASAAAPVAMARPLGTRQCEQGGPTADALAQTLRDAGLTVGTVACGHDGRMRPQVCGAPDGRLAIVEIDAGQQARAEALGWRPLSSLPDAVRETCA